MSQASELGRFTVIDSSEDLYKLTFFDKTIQTDYLAVMFVPMYQDAASVIGCAVVSWQLNAVVVGEVMN